MIPNASGTTSVPFYMSPTIKLYNSNSRGGMSTSRTVKMYGPDPEFYRYGPARAWYYIKLSGSCSWLQEVHFMFVECSIQYYRNDLICSVGCSLQEWWGLLRFDTAVKANRRNAWTEMLPSSVHLAGDRSLICARHLSKNKLQTHTSFFQDPKMYYVFTRFFFFESPFHQVLSSYAIVLTCFPCRNKPCTCPCLLDD
jgi:hypothetical protein